MESADKRFKEALRLLIEAGCLDLLVGGGVQSRTAWCASSRAEAAVFACSLPRTRKEVQEVQVGDRGRSRVRGVAKAKGKTWAEEDPQGISIQAALEIFGNGGPRGQNE
ncbi:hypothetical protein NDU88_008319 [Pleurodeles waltl]|uniref:Uncharacterized protein n=1 Tax=Pleurodeles waltl TaxID=8319 RepID=A0AAV7NYW9_PLEWA|nr:hypothetical protein NDU88_008319 [Pleurodeles waltl]